MGRKSKSGFNSGGYKAFSDTASSGFTYHGDGSEQVAFFRDNSNADSLISSMDYDEQDDFRTWARGWFMDGQQYAGWDNMSPRDQQLTATYDKYLDQATLTQGVQLSRLSDSQLVLGAGNSRGSLADLQAMEGQIVTCSGSMSFGAAAQGLKIGSGVGKNVEYKLKIPPSTGAGMWIGDKRINGWGPEQREFMTNRDIAIKVGKSYRDKARGVNIVEIEFVGRLPHDYGTKGIP